MNLSALIDKAKRENFDLDIKSACFAMGFMAGQEARKREMNTPICVTVGQLYDVEILKCFDMIFFFNFRVEQDS